MSKPKLNTREDALLDMFQSWPRDRFEDFRGRVMARAEEFRAVLRQEGALEFVRQFYEVYDHCRAQDTTLVNCSKGCHFCCRQNVDLMPAEADVIAAYCEENNISISREYLHQQLKYDKTKVSTSPVGWCVFLKDGECSIYPVRPINCRNYFVISAPENCDIEKQAGAQVRSVILEWPMMLAIAFHGVLAEVDKEGRMPELLLKYSK